ncbi:MAG: hypothetical protein K2Z80_00310 [Xanthobacteraceae bacterium]|nr:hypothetical protein [Xanthobacteraceae bacterium]
MRAALLPVVMVFGALLTEAAKAQTFCAVNHEGATNCTFTSVERCRDEVRADGGFCIPQAPVGHRQPRARDLPSGVAREEANPPQSARTRRLDRDVQICRSC